VQTGAVSGSYECKVAEDRDITTTDVFERTDTAVTKLQISPLIVNGFKNGFH